MLLQKPLVREGQSSVSGEEVVAFFSTFLAGVRPLHHSLPLNQRHLTLV